MFSFLEASKYLDAPLLLQNNSCYVSGACIDSRKIEPGNLFVAIRSDRNDGHHYLDQAFLKGAAGALIERDFYAANADHMSRMVGRYQNLLVVSDTSKAFLDIAKWYRLRINPTCIGITGSVGKTSTKEFLHYLLRKKHPVLATKGNQNNHLGLPLTLLSLQPRDQYCIAELGANKRGDIAELGVALQPSRAILTGVSPAHLKGFGSLENIYETKLELLSIMKPRSFAVLPSYDKKLLEKASRFPLKRITVGECDDADRKITNIRQEKGFIYFCLDGEHEFSFPGIARFMALNAALAVVTTEILGISLDELPKEWDDFVLPEGRLSVNELSDGVQIIDDGYNASPYSVEKAIEALSEMKTRGRKFLVISDMLELGPDEKQWHSKIGEIIGKSKIDFVASYGPLSVFTMDAIRLMNHSIHTEHFEDPLRLAAVLKHELKRGDIVLLKASRGMKIERVVQALKGETLQQA